MASYFFPCLFLNPNFDDKTIEANGAKLHKRLWDTTIFDLATLSTKHRLHFDWQIIGAFLRHVNIEIEVTSADSPIEAQEYARKIQSMLYIEGVHPFVMPYFSTNSINEYSGINSRDSHILNKDLPPELRSGPTSESIKVEAWLHEPSFFCAQTELAHEVSADAFRIAVENSEIWSILETKFSALRIVNRVLTTSPLISDLSSRLLHLWTGIESLFPNVQSEVSFRIAILTSQLTANLKAPYETYPITKKLYAARSHAAHGNINKIDKSSVDGTWTLLTRCMSGIINRNHLPDEDELLRELLGFCGK